MEVEINDGKTHGLNQATYSTELCEKLFNIYMRMRDILFMTLLWEQAQQQMLVF